MKLVKCDKGHYYDASSYDACPHCKMKAINIEKKESKSEVASSFEQEEKKFVNTDIIEKTTPMDMDFGSVKETKDESSIPFSFENEEIENDLNESIVDTLSVKRPEEIEATQPFVETGSKNNPVVGWLIAIDGPHFGESFSLIAGRNFIGRNIGLQIRLVEDKKVTRDAQATVMFDPESSLFFVEAGKSSGLAYINNQMISNITEIHKKDIIKLGNTRLLFIPFIDDEINWNHFIKERVH